MAPRAAPKENRPAREDGGKGRTARRTWMAVGAVLVVTVLAYARTLHGEFQLDDFSSIVENPSIRNLRNVLSGFLPALLRSGRPVTDLTFALNQAAGGLDPFGYHVANVAIHLCVVALVWTFTRRVMLLAGAPRPVAVSLVVAILFALHPLQTQAVSYVAQRSESLASGLYLSTLLLLLLAERLGRTPRGLLAYAGAALSFLLGIGAKPIVVTLPVAYLLLAWAVPRDSARAELTSWPRRLGMALPLAAMDLLVSTRTVASIETRIDAGFSVPGLPPFTYFLTQWKVLVTYLRLVVWPVGQFVDWSFPAATGLGDLDVLGSGALLLGLVVIATWLLLSGRSRSGVAGGACVVSGFGILWFFLLLAPTSSVVPLADALMEHRVYLASWGIFVAAVVAGERIFDRLGARPAVAASVVTFVLGLLAAVTYTRNSVWETRLGLWSDEVARAPGNWRARLNLGFAHSERGMTEAALREFQTAYSGGGDATPANAAFILNNIGAVLANAGRGPEAIAPLRRSLELRPDDPDVLFNLATTLKDQGQPETAEALVTRAVEIQPGHVLALNLLGTFRLDRGDAAGALNLFQRASAVNPGDAASQFNVAAAVGRLGRRDEACRRWARIAASPAADPSIRELAGRALANEGCPR